MVVAAEMAHLKMRNGHFGVDMHIQTFDLSRAIPDTVIMANHPYVPEQLGPNYGP